MKRSQGIFPSPAFLDENYSQQQLISVFVRLVVIL